MSLASARGRVIGVGHSPGQLMLWLLSLVCMVGLVGCGAITKHASTPPATKATAAATSARTPLTLRQAWGKPTIHSLPLLLGTDRAFVFPLSNGAATPDGQWLIGASQPRDFYTKASAPSYAVLYNVVTQQVVTMAQLRTSRSQIVGASADSDWVVWMEADDSPNYFDWTLYAFNRQTTQVQMLAQATKDASGSPVPGAFSGPFVDSGHVLWAQPKGDVSQSIDNLVVREEDLSSGQTQTLATGDLVWGLSWPWADWGSVAPKANSTTLANLATGQRLTIPTTGIVALSGTSVAYLPDLSTIDILDNFTRGTSTPLTLTPTTGVQSSWYLSLSQRLVAWSPTSGLTSSRAIVYDRQLRRYVSLPTTNGGEGMTWTGGHLLVWTDPQPISNPSGLDPAGTIDVIDTSTLPTSIGG